MKWFSIFILIIFVSYLSTTTVVTLIKKVTDVTVFYSFSVEEIHKDSKEVNPVKSFVDYPFTDFELRSDSKIISENLSCHDNVAEEIFSPPPELI